MPRSRPSLLVIGCGDIGMRVLRLLRPRFIIWALTSSPERLSRLRAAGAIPVLGNLDDAASLQRLASVARLTTSVLHLAPPPGQGLGDPRTAHLLQALLRCGSPPQRLVYASTSGVYGDCAGELVDETRPVAPASDRARRRVAAETLVRAYGRTTGACVSILRIPGIYAGDRPGGHPRERLLRGTPALRQADDVYSNHIHADDLARICVATLWRGLPQRVVHASDDSDLKMGDYFDLAADLCGLPRPPRISREQASQQLSPVLLSFMSESRRLGNQRLKQELGVRLRYPTVEDGLRGT
jgi:nucleoside-diphosphate-sugar epimerase